MAANRESFGTPREVDPLGRSRGPRSESTDRAEPGARPLFYSVSEAAQIVGAAPVTLYRAIRAGEFPAVRIRGRLIVPARALDALVSAAIADQSLIDAAEWTAEGGVAR